MRTILLTLGLAGLAFAPACKKEQKKSEGTEAAESQPPVTGTSGTPAPAETPPATAEPAAGEAPAMANKMRRCPSAVSGAETKVEEGKGTVVLTVTAKEPAQVAEIQKRAEHLDKVEGAPDAEIKHTGQGTGGGASGKCPVVMTDVTLEVEEQTDGVKITLTPKDASKASELARTASDRVNAMASAPRGGDMESEDEKVPGEVE